MLKRGVAGREPGPLPEDRAPPAMGSKQPGMTELRAANRQRLPKLPTASIRTSCCFVCELMHGPTSVRIRRTVCSSLRALLSSGLKWMLRSRSGVLVSHER